MPDAERHDAPPQHPTHAGPAAQTAGPAGGVAGRTFAPREAAFVRAMLLMGGTQQDVARGVAFAWLVMDPTLQPEYAIADAKREVERVQAAIDAERAH